ncbi:MAG: tetratricopeptide repeat protein [Treponema sp.]|jgi:putative GTP pyrophosphokinase|nr:tetratricopeptide repeat protein [Treponema sp.]
MKDDINRMGLAPNKAAFKKVFEANSAARNKVIRDIGERVEETFSSLLSHPALKFRVKKFDSYYKKYLRLLKSGIPNPNITDLIGIRIICPFIEDLTPVERLVEKHFDVTEVERKGHFTFKEFGYESTHLLIKVPADIVQKRGSCGCDVAEIQIRTILQDAWAEVEHELVYKAEFNPFDTPMKRKLAAVNASLSLADIIFQEIRGYQKELNGQLGKRRETFYQKIEESTDDLLFSGDSGQKAEPPHDVLSLHQGVSSIDDLLLDALYAHNKNQFEDAIALYSQILGLRPQDSILSLIYKHRGMAYFAQSKYQEAIEDFTRSLEMDKNSYKTAYYRGLVHSVLKQHAQSIDDFTISLEINPFQAYCLFRRGQAYYHIGDHLQALSDCEASLGMEPQNETVKKFRMLLQGKLKM